MIFSLDWRFLASPIVGVPTRGPGSQLVILRVSSSQMMMQEAITVTHGFILVPAAGPYVQQRGCAMALYYLAPGVLVVGDTSKRERGREAPKSLLGVESVEVSAQ